MLNLDFDEVVEGISDLDSEAWEGALGSILISSMAAFRFWELS